MLGGGGSDEGREVYCGGVWCMVVGGLREMGGGIECSYDGRLLRPCGRW